MKSMLIAFATLAGPVAAQEIDPHRGTENQIPTCVSVVHDQATGGCVGLSSTPTIGMLYPFSSYFNLDGSGQLNIGQTSIGGVGMFCSIVNAVGVHADVIRAEGFGVTVAGDGRIGVGTISPSSRLHILDDESAEIRIEADADNVDEFDHPRVRFLQDGGAVEAYVGYQDGLNDLAVRNLYTAGGLRFDLYSSSTRDWEFRRRTAAAVDVEARITQSGSLQLDGSVSSPAADLAEFYPVEGNVEPGDVVAFTGRGLALERARQGAAGRLAGVISSRPAFAMGLSYTDEEELGVEYEGFADEAASPVATAAHGVDAAVLHEIEVNRRAPLALSGRIPCKVSAENGPIEPGDLLSLSTLPGHAAKALHSGAVIGTALEDWPAGEGTILVLANLGWFSHTDDLERGLTRLQAEVDRLTRRVEALSKR